MSAKNLVRKGESSVAEHEKVSNASCIKQAQSHESNSNPHLPPTTANSTASKSGLVRRNSNVTASGQKIPAAATSTNPSATQQTSAASSVRDGTINSGKDQTGTTGSSSQQPMLNKKKKKEKKITLHLSACKYPVLRRVAKACGMNTIEEDDELDLVNFNIMWADTVIPLDRLSEFQPWQHFNHFPSMYNITRKLNLSITMGKMQKGLPDHFAFVPRSWSLKSERQNFIKYFSGMTYANGSIVQQTNPASGSTAPALREEHESANSLAPQQHPSSSSQPNTNAKDAAAVATILNGPNATSSSGGNKMVSSKQVFILKPNAGCQGKGIILTKDPLAEVDNPEDYVVQEYISRPLLIDGRKFDLRVYCLVTSMKYPSIFVFNEGLVRLCAEAYEKPNAENMSNVCKHLTNFAVNKKSEAYQAATSQGDVGSKRNFQWFNKWLDEVLTDEMLGIRSNNNAGNEKGSRSARLWADIDHIIVKTVLSAQPKVRHSYNMLFPSSKNDGYTCFEVLGFDILIDHKLQPWLMEVNHTPSFVTGTTMDLQVKGALIREVLSVINPTGRDKQRWKVRQINQRNQRALLGENGKSADDDSDDGDDVRISPIRSPTTAAEVAEALEIGFGGEFASNNENWTSNGLPDLQKIPINTNEYRQAHEKLEDHRIVNFRRVYPVPEDAAIIKATRELNEKHPEQYHSLIRECEIAEGSAHQSRANGSSKTIPILSGGNHPYAHKIIAAAASLRTKPPKENHITTPGEVSDINHRIAATLSQSELDMRRNIYGEVIEYTSVHNAAKKDPNRLRRTSAANGTTSTGADSNGVTGEANKENARVENNDQHQHREVTNNPLPLKMAGKNNQSL